jgi:hypothetical protein
MDIEANGANSVADVHRHPAHEIGYPHPDFHRLWHSRSSAMSAHRDEPVFLPQRLWVAPENFALLSLFQHQRIDYHEKWTLPGVFSVYPHVKKPGFFRA